MKCKPIFEIERVKLEHHCPGQCPSLRSEETPVERMDELGEPTRSLPIFLGADSGRALSVNSPQGHNTKEEKQ
jgi:hypothetical protein